MLKFFARLSAFFLFFSLMTAAYGNDDHQFTIIKEGNKKGLFDADGKMIIPAIYDDLGWSKGLPQVFHKVLGYKENGYWGLINTKNQKITPPLFTSLQPFHDKLIIAGRKTTGKPAYFGLINHKGEQELEFRYHSLEKNNEDLMAYILEKNYPQYGVINRRGQALIGFNYRRIVPVSAQTYALYDQQQKAALFTTSGDALTSFAYDSIAPFEHHFAVVFRQGKQGVIREDGKLVVPVDYNRVKIDGAHKASVLPFGKWHVFTGENKPVREYTFETIRPAGMNLYQVEIGNIQTFVDLEGKALLPAQWRVVRLEGDFAVIAHQGKYGLLSHRQDSSRILLQPEYDSLILDGASILAGKQNTSGDYAWSLFDEAGNKLSYYVYQDIRKKSEGYFPVKRKNYWGYLNEKGEETISCQYLAAEPFRQQRAKVDFMDGQGVIDTQGNWVIKPFKYNGATLHLARIHDDLFIFGTQRHHYQVAKYGLVNQEGEEIYVSDYPLIDNGSSVWERNDQGKYGLVSYEGRRLLPTRYDTISALQEGVAYTFSKDGKSGILGKEGNMLLDVKNNFQELFPISEQYFGVKIDGKFGFVDTLGRLRIANRYDSITHFVSGMAAVSLMGRWGYINKMEHIVVQPQFDRAYPFEGRLAIVKKADKLGMVDKRGMTVVPVAYDRILPAKEDRFLVVKENQGQKMGLISQTGTLLIYPKYDRLEDLGNGYVIATRGEKYGLLTIDGRSTIPLIYDDLICDPYNKVYLALESKGWQTIDLPVEAK